MILDEIIAYKKQELADTKRAVPFSELKARVADAEPTRGFEKASTPKAGIRLIAEVKKASPSKGVIREDFDPVEIAKTYARSGADCLSVLTEKKYFQGKLEYLSGIRKAVNLPLLRKDFIVEEYQVFEARAAGADAVLLIAACLERRQLEDLFSIAQRASASTCWSSPIPIRSWTGRCLPGPPWSASTTGTSRASRSACRPRWTC